MTRSKRTLNGWTSNTCVLFFLLAAFSIAASLYSLNAESQSESTKITVWFKPNHPANRFIPSHFFGAAIDGHEKGEIDRMLSPENIREMLTAGLKPLSYRLRTELAAEAWHWSPNGFWSDRWKRRGYWTSSSAITQRAISVSYGYALPRRGNTLDQANDDGYSRLDDGSLESFWKSNPYLDQHFTAEPNPNLPQWVVIDLGSAKFINAIRIDWGKPFARLYDVQYGSYRGADDVSQSLPDVWQTFPNGAVRLGRGGSATLQLSSQPVRARFVRVLMEESSGGADRRSSDVRDRLGYAIREIYVGTLTRDGSFHDELRHAPGHDKQSPVYVSSTDPWHEATDKDTLIEQPGFDRIFRSGLTNGLPVLIPIPVLYNTPENAAAQIRYLKKRGYRVEKVELGEEPDGQFVTPEDYAALYIQFAAALHAVDPTLIIGGPSFQDIEPGDGSELVESGKPVWLKRFLAYLNKRGKLSEYKFFSFEWYPFDDVCQPTAPQLAQASDLLKNSLMQMQKGGLSHHIPWIITEYGYSAFGGRAEMDLEGAILNADILGTFLGLGGEQAFLYGYEPNEVIHEVPCSSGNNMLFQSDNEGAISSRMPTYYGARLTTLEWVQPGNGLHELYLASVVGAEQRNEKLVTVYAVHRPDGLWALLVLNKDPNRVRTVEVKFHNEDGGAETTFAGRIDVYQYSRKQYELSADQLEPYPVKNETPEHQTLSGTQPGIFLPPYSLTVIRGSVQF